MRPTIEQAASVIREIDPALASLFVQEPLRRTAIVEALHRSMSESNLAPAADHVAVICRSAIDGAREAAAITRVERF